MRRGNDSHNLQLTFSTLCILQKGLVYNAASIIQIEAFKVHCYTCLPIDKNNIILAFQV
jgi:hypothetical protein